jgi:hypothetical protein
LYFKIASVVELFNKRILNLPKHALVSVPLFQLPLDNLALNHIKHKLFVKRLLYQEPNKLNSKHARRFFYFLVVCVNVVLLIPFKLLFKLIIDKDNAVTRI